MNQPQPHSDPPAPDANGSPAPAQRPVVLYIKKNLDRAELEFVLEAHRRGIRIHVLASKTSPGRERLETLGIYAEAPAPHIKVNPALVRRVRQMIRSLGITVIHATDSSSLAAALWATYFTRVRIIAYRGTLARIRRHDPTFWIGILHPRVARIICVNQAVYDYMRQYVPADKLRLIYKGYSPDWLAGGDPPERPPGVPADAIVVMYLAYAKGRPYKGLSVLVDAMNLVQDERVHLVFIGTWDPAVAKARQESRHAGRIHLLDARVDASTSLRFADIFVLPSLRDALPRTVKEAMAAGLPVIASNIPGVAEMVADRETGFLVEPGSPAAIARAIDTLGADEVLRRRMGARGRERLTEVFGFEQYVEKVVDLYFEQTR